MTIPTLGKQDDLSIYQARVYKINTDPDTNGGNKNSLGLGEIRNGLGLYFKLITLLPLTLF